MSGKSDRIDELNTGAFFVDPSTLPGYKKPKSVRVKDAMAYADRVNKQENRQVTFEEMQQFVTY